MFGGLQMKRFKEECCPLNCWPFKEECWLSIVSDLLTWKGLKNGKRMLALKLFSVVPQKDAGVLYVYNIIILSRDPSKCAAKPPLVFVVRLFASCMRLFAFHPSVVLIKYKQYFCFRVQYTSNLKSFLKIIK